MTIVISLPIKTALSNRNTNKGMGGDCWLGGGGGGGGGVGSGAVKYLPPFPLQSRIIPTQ